MKFPAVCSALLVLLSSKAVSGVILKATINLEPLPSKIHYVKGLLYAPAEINLSGMDFITNDDAGLPGDDDDGDGDDEPEGDEDGDSTEPPTPATTASPTSKPHKTHVPTRAPTPAPSSSSISASTESPTSAPTGSPTAADGSDDTEEPTAEPTDSTAGPTPDTADSTEAPTPLPTAQPTVAQDQGGEPTPDTANTEAPTAEDTDGDRLRVLSISADAAEGDARSLKIRSDDREDSTLDIVLFRLPDSCASSRTGCNWVPLGIGVNDDSEKGGVSYCCTQATIDRGLCQRSQKNRLLIDRANFKGQKREMGFAATGEIVNRLDDQDAIFKLKHDGTYALVLANCNPLGRDVLAIGKMEWKNERGFLPGELYSLMQFYIILALVYLVTFVIYSILMRVYKDSMIPIQKYIIATIGLGLLELSFRALDLHVWDSNGIRSEFLMYPAIVFGVLKRGISRCLLVMVAMGWGIVRDSLGAALYQIILLGLIYTGLSGFRDIFEVVAVEEVQSISTTGEKELVGLVVILTTVIIVINITFYFWIVNNLKATSVYLENMNQSSKLKKHNQLGIVIMLSMVFAGVWLALQAIEVLFDVLTADQEWVLDASVHVNYVFVLTSVAILWMPNTNAKEYAYIMELNTEDMDGDNDLELSTIGTGLDDSADGNDPDHPDGLAVDDGRLT